MLLLTVFLLASGQTVFADVGDDRSCTVTVAGTVQYSFQSTMCVDLGPDNCKKLFEGAAVAPGTSDTRPVQCYEPATNKTLAIKYCAAYCGFCCLTEQFTCDNKPFPAIPCDQITEEQCQDPKLKNEIKDNCPASCGFCDEKGCVDLVDTEICEKDEKIVCTRDPTFAAQNCRRTCDYCTSYGGDVSTTTTTKSTNTGACVDNANCNQWKNNGFCDNPFYTPAERQKYCPKTCGLC